MRKEMRKSPKIPVQVDTFMFIIFLTGSMKTCSGIAGHLVIGTNICLFTANMGLGPSLADSERVFSKTSWFATN